MCSVIGCASWLRSAQRFKLPEDPEKRREWVEYIFEVNGQRLKESSWTDITICSEHFTEDCFENRTPTGPVKLNAGAAPSLRAKSELESPAPQKNPALCEQPVEMTITVPQFDDLDTCFSATFNFGRPKDNLKKIATVSEEESDASDFSEKSDEGMRVSDEEWDPPDDSLSEELEEDSESESDHKDDKRKMELCTDCGCFFDIKKYHMCEHQMKPHACKICGKRCTNETALKNHSVIHDDSFIHPCRFCHKPFKTKQGKLKHEQIHKYTADPYKCPDCPEAFATCRERRVHMETHRTQKLSCGVCGMEFSRKDQLRRHSAVHTGLKPHQCSLCQRGFNQMSHLKSHMRVHTGERPFTCEHCDKSFNHNVSLKSHVQQCHSSGSGSKQKRDKKNENGSETGGTQDGNGAECVDQGEKKTEDRVNRPKNKRRSLGRPIGRPKRNHVDNGPDCEPAQEEENTRKKVTKRTVKPKESVNMVDAGDSDFDPEDEKKTKQNRGKFAGKCRGRPVK